MTVLQACPEYDRKSIEHYHRKQESPLLEDLTSCTRYTPHHNQPNAHRQFPNEIFVQFVEIASHQSMRITLLNPVKLISDNVLMDMEQTVGLPLVKHLPKKPPRNLLPWLVCWHSWRQKKIVLVKGEILLNARFVWRTMKLDKSFLDWSVCANFIRIVLWIGLKGRLNARCIRFLNSFLMG